MARIVIGLSTFAGIVSRRLCLPLATIGITACCDRPSGLSDAEKPVLDRIRQVRELRVAAAEYWPGVDAPHYDTPLLYLTDSVCYAVNPTSRLREEYGARPVYRDADIAIYKTVLPDSLPFHMEVQNDFGQPEDGTELIPTLFCSSPEITRTFEPDVTDDALWLPMVIHEYAHGFQFQQPGFAGAFRTSVANVPEMELASLHKQHDWLDRAVREENTALLEALQTADDKVRDSCIVRFKELRRARKQRMATILGDSIVRSEEAYELMEGMARFIETQAGIRLGSYTGDEDWLRDTDRAGYFFATGYNLIRLLDRCGADKSQLFTARIRPLEDFLTITEDKR